MLAGREPGPLVNVWDLRGPRIVQKLRAHANNDALKAVDEQRSSLGAVQNRLDSAISNIDTTQINISSARSRITDADYATEVSNMSKAVRMCRSCVAPISAGEPPALPVQSKRISSVNVWLRAL